MNYVGSGLKLTFTKVATATFLSISLFLPCFAAFTIDPSFGPGGKLTISFPDSSSNYSSQAHRVFVQSGGRVIVGGSFTNFTPDGQLPGVAVVGLLPNGTLDPAFGSGGGAIDWRPDASTSFSDSLMYVDGRILRISQLLRLPAGMSSVQSVRLGADGSTDSVFASNVSIGGSGFFTPRPSQIAVRSDGKILALITEGSAFFLYRLNPDGTRDTTFGVNGVVPIIFNKMSFPSDNNMEMIALSDGKILLTGHVEPLSFPNGSSQFFLARLTESGNWDKTFGRVGFMRVPFGQGMTGRIQDALVQPDEKILLCGSVSSSDTDVWMTRLRPNGRTDTTFGTDGVVINDFAPGGTDVGTAMALSADGKIRLVGYLGNPQNFLVTRFAANGAFEESTSFSFTPGQYAGANDVTFQPDGKLLVAGYTRNSNLSINGSIMAITRLTE